MTLKEFKEKVDNVVYQYWSNPDVVNMGDYDIALWLFAHIFEHRGYPATFGGLSKNMMDLIDELGNLDEDEMNEMDDGIRDSDFYPTAIDKDIDCDATIKEIIKEYKSDGFFINQGLFITQEFMMSMSGYLFFTTPEIPDRVKKCYVKISKKDRFFGYVSCGRNGFRTTNMKIKELCTDDNFLDNYNEDLPWEKITNFVRGEYSGLMLMYGSPGTGKTTAIRHLIATNDDIKFFWLDQAMLDQVTNSDFLDFLLEHKNSVFILEDCEILLRSRENGGNGLINSLLNMSDGILGDSLNIKFLCTFNTNIKNIDTALQRKGRLKLQYEFKPLTKDRVHKLFDVLGIEEEAKEMPLCDVYNYSVDNGVKKKETKRIGF